MVQSLTIGTVGNIQIRLHPTLVLVPIWVAVDTVSSGHPLGGGSLFYSLALIALVFGCVLLHELGHALMAASYGVRARDITLSVIGGVARLEYFPVRPRSEVLIALAGPAVNVAIVVTLLPLFALFSVLTGVDGWHGVGRLLIEPSVGGLFAAVLVANLMLISFNLLPIFPMDGGRVLRAVLSKSVGREAGTQTAVVVGQVLALVMAVVGIVVLQNLTFVLLALFIIAVGHAEGRSVRVEGAMRRMSVGQYALWDRGGIAPGERLTNALQGGPRDLVVTESGRVIGMLWRNTVLSALQGGLTGKTVADVMDPDVLSVNVDDSVFDVQRLMNQHGRWAVPVTEDGQYRGIFTADRFVHLYRQLTPAPVLPKYVHGVTNVANSLARLWVR